MFTQKPWDTHFIPTTRSTKQIALLRSLSSLRNKKRVENMLQNLMSLNGRLWGLVLNSMQQRFTALDDNKIIIRHHRGGWNTYRLW